MNLILFSPTLELIILAFCVTAEMFCDIPYDTDQTLAMELASRVNQKRKDPDDSIRKYRNLCQKLFLADLRVIPVSDKPSASRYSRRLWFFATFCIAYLVTIASHQYLLLE